MKVTDLILADYAAVDEKGKFTLVGAGFSDIASRKFPFVHPVMYVLVRLEVSEKDRGRNQIRLQIISEKEGLFQADLNMNVSDSHTGVRQVPLPARLVNLQFKEAGQYQVELRINGELKRAQTLCVRALPEK